MLLWTRINNFKDPDVQYYGQAELLNSIRDDMDSIFCGLPALIPASTNTGYDLSTPPNNDASGPCTVKLFDGSIKLVKDIQRGDRLYLHGGTVKYIFKTIRTDSSAKMVFVCIPISKLVSNFKVEFKYSTILHATPFTSPSPCLHCISHPHLSPSPGLL